MWCRTILTAVAISCTFKREIIVRADGQGPQHLVQIKDVICMLLWSGLQKEDLDASTLEKLARYNVNIDDMNNEQRRQECLLDHVTTEVQREALRTAATIERLGNDVTVGIYPKIGMLLAANFEDKTVIPTEANMNKTKGNIDEPPVAPQKMPDLSNAKNVEGNKGIIKIEYNIQNQPDVESVMNFWTKLTRFTTTVGTTLPTTLVVPVTATTQLGHQTKNITTRVQAESHNNGYVHSREMEYISRILAEYLASQTVPTTTQKVSTKKVIPNYVPIKYWEISSKAPVEEKPKVNEQSNEINKINNVSQDDLHSAKAVYNSLLDEIKSMPFKTTYDSTQLHKRPHETPSSQIQRNKPKAKESKPVQRNNPIGILQRLLKMKHDLFNNGVVIPETESSTETIKLFTNKSNEQQDISESFHFFDVFQNMKDVNKNNVENDQSTSASITAETWEPVPLNKKKINKEFKASPIGKKGTEQMQNFNTNSNQIEIIRPDMKKWILHKNLDSEHKGSQFQAMLPSIKVTNTQYSKQNEKSENTNHEVIGLPTDFNKQQQNEDTEWFVVKKAIVSQQPAAIEKFPRNQLFKMKNDTFKADSEIKSNITENSKEFNGKEMKKAPVFRKWEPTHDSKKIKAIQEIINNFDQDNEQLTRVNASGWKPTQNLDSMNMPDLPANVIKDIAEKVKQMVLKDIVEDVTTATMGITTTVGNTTTVGTNSSTNSTTAVPTTISSALVTTTITTSEKQSTSLQEEFTKANHVMQKLMEIFKELKAMKDTAKLTSQMPQNTTTVRHGTTRLPPLPVQPYPKAVAAFNPYLMQNPPIFKPIPKNPYNPRIVPGPISSAVNPPRQKVLQYMPPLNMQPTKDYHFGAITIQTNSDEIAPLAIQISKPSKVMNQHIVLTTKRTVDKQREERERESMKHIEEKFRIPNKDRNYREKLEHQSDLPKHVRFAEKHEISDRYSYRGGRYVDREKPWYNHEYHEKVHNMENTHPVRSRFPELHYPGRLSHLEHVSRPRDLSISEDLSHSRGYTRPGYNEPGSHQNGIRHHPGSYSPSDYDRQPRYEATKFHEKLERIEKWPRSSTWKDFQSPSDSSNDEISARQQMPLVKVKQRTRYDDSHFTNFLKSQQKVTDMLEKILANNVKNSGPHSVETP